MFSVDMKFLISDFVWASPLREACARYTNRLCRWQSVGHDWSKAASSLHEIDIRGDVR